MLTAALVAHMSSAAGASSPDDFHAHETLKNSMFQDEFSAYRNVQEEAAADRKPWGTMILLTFIVNLATLSGVLLFVPMLSRKAHAWTKAAFWNEAIPEVQEKGKDNDNDTEKEEDSHIINVVIPSFASGALLATSVFLIIPEALVHIQEHIAANEMHDDLEEDEEHEGEIKPAAIWRFGTALLCGFMIPLVLDAIFPRNKEHFAGDNCQVEDGFSDDVEQDHGAPVVKDKVEVRKVNYGLAASILLGDAFHNFCDGVFIGVALLLCDVTTAYTIMAVTLYHEVAQELADYFLLTKHAGLKPAVALSLNFVSGLSVMLGGIVVLATPVSDMTVGVTLSVGSGVYLHIAAAECLPRVTEVIKSRKDRLVSIFFFIVGVVPIALTLLGHSHCEA